jgi:hypothetical protein
VTPVVTGTPPAQALVPVVTVTTGGTASGSLPPSTATARSSGGNDNLLVGALAGTGLALLAALVVLVTIAVRKRP